jgi:hypothetical protein
MIDFSNVLAGQMFDVTVSLGKATKTKRLKVCKINTRTILFIEVNKDLRLNTFYKFPRKKATRLLDKLDPCVLEFENGVMPDKWESSWDSIGGFSNSVQSYGRFANAARPSLTNYSSYMKPSTTNSAAGFPMV